MTEDEARRLSTLERGVSAMKVEQADMRRSIEDNTAVTNAVKADTAEIVSLMKGAGILGKMETWFAGIVGAYLAGKGLKWW